jgi:hypothetical protein
LRHPKLNQITPLALVSNGSERVGNVPYRLTTS